MQNYNIDKKIKARSINVMLRCLIYFRFYNKEFIYPLLIISKFHRSFYCSYSATFISGTKI